jgi:hypothetical protein
VERDVLAIIIEIELALLVLVWCIPNKIGTAWLSSGMPRSINYWYAIKLD